MATSTINIGINGFGRIGRQVTRAILEHHKGVLRVAAINDLTNAATNAHMFKYDTTYGVYPGSVEAVDGDLSIDGDRITVFAQRDPAALPWSDAGVDLVVESTGFFTDGTKAAGHLKGGAKKVIISAPAKGEDLTIVLGVNADIYNPAIHHVVSNASCTTNCAAPMAKVLHDSFGIQHALMSTFQSYTGDQSILDQVHEDLRRARAAAANIIPTTTGAARAVTQVIPDLKGRIDGMAYRVPTLTVSVTDLTVLLERKTTTDEINEAYKSAASADLKGILTFSNEPLVSSDFRGNPSSATIDGLSTAGIGSNFFKIVGWYDNEWGYASRTADLAAFMAKKGL